jgi:hypothetical protein
MGRRVMLPQARSLPACTHKHPAGKTRILRLQPRSRRKVSQPVGAAHSRGRRLWVLLSGLVRSASF